MANLYPTTTSTTTTLPETKSFKVAFGNSWRFDYEQGDFVMTPTGKVAESKDEDAWLEWCQKAVLTERYLYLIYSRKYGQEFRDLIRRNLNRAGNESEIKRIVTECLKVDPRTVSVDNFTFTWRGEQCYFNCQVTSVRGTVGTIGGRVGV